MFTRGVTFLVAVPYGFLPSPRTVNFDAKCIAFDSA